MMASLLINYRNNTVNELYIMGGQNSTQIKLNQEANIALNWDPCIAITFLNTQRVTITFEKVTTFEDWYPYQICYKRQNNSRKYTNTYLFAGGQSLTINNLVISDYIKIMHIIPL